MRKRSRQLALSAAVAAVLILTAGFSVPWAQKRPSPGPEKKLPLAGLAAPSVKAAPPEGATYVGSETCGGCHDNELAQWSLSGHANMLRPVSPKLVRGDFTGQEIVFEGVEVQGADKSKVKISPKVRTERVGDDYFVVLLDAADPSAAQRYQVVEVLGSIWEQQYYLKAGDAVYPSPVRFVIADKQWRKAPFATFWWTADGAPGGRPKRADELPAKESVDYQCNGCHTTGFTARKDAQGKYAFTRAEGGIGCETCHGPGSVHAAAQGKGGIVNPAKLGTWQREQLCGQCHGRVTSKQDKDFAFPLGFVVGATDLQDRVEFWSYSTKPANFWPNTDAKKNRQQYHDAMRGRHLEAGVVCSTCHLDHATKHRGASLKKPREEQCADCHVAQKAMFEGSQHASKGVVCVDCHMAKMGNRAGATLTTPKEPIDVTAHSMRVVLPAEAEAFKMRSSCDKCHKDADRAVYGGKLDSARAQVLGQLAKARASLDAKKAAGPSRARDNLNQVLLDGSLGAHNPAKAAALLSLK